MTGRRVLVVDDSALSRAVIARQLSRHGYQVSTAEDGAEGAVLALQERPDLVVTDLDMPVMDGYQLARLLKSDPATEHVAVLILTSHKEASSRFWGLETGADAYLIKDDLEEELLPEVESILASSRPAPRSTGEVPRTPLEVLARVSRHLDSKLLEAVLVNHLLERGMKAETLEEASTALLDVLGEIADVWMLGLAVAEPDSTTVFLRLHPEVSTASAETVLRHLDDHLEDDVVERETVILGGREDGRTPDPDSLRTMPLPLRGARAMLLVMPRTAERWARSRESRLLSHSLRHAALVLDNARLAQRLRELSMQDGLTRLLNRRTVHQRLEEEMARARRYDHPLSLVLCDLDHFKEVNDTYGHLAGDAVLVAVAELLRHRGRTTDVAGRYGGEEFVFVLPETDLGAAVAAAGRIRNEIESQPTVLPDGFELRITASLGVAALSEIDEDGGPDDLLGLADERLYRAKDTGRNRVVP